MFTTIIIFILILGLLVFVHELGHFWTARKFGVKAEEFGFGFPPRFAGYYKDTSGKWRFVWGSKEVEDASDTVYSINWLPLGGFVKIKGEQGDSKEDGDSFSAQKIWKRIVILAAGVTMNVITAAIVLSIALWIGLPQLVEDIPPGANARDNMIQVVEVVADSPAQEAGITPGDAIVSVNGQTFDAYTQLQEYTAARAGEELTYTLRRGDEMVTVTAIPEALEGTDRAGVGIAIAETAIVSYPWYRALWEGIIRTGQLLVFIVVAFVGIIASLVTGAGVGAEVAGPVGIANMTGQVAQLGFAYLLQFTALLSLNLAIVNILPFPALDGGRIIFLTIEKMRGKPVPEKYEAWVHQTGFLLLMLLVVLVTYRDIAKLVG